MERLCSMCRPSQLSVMLCIEHLVFVDRVVATLRRVEAVRVPHYIHSLLNKEE